MNESCKKFGKNFTSEKELEAQGKLKVTLKSISNNWLISNEQAHQILTRWVTANAKTGKSFSNHSKLVTFAATTDTA